MKKKTLILISSVGIGTILLLLLLIILLPHIRNRFNGPNGLVFAKSPDKESYIVVGIKDDSITDIVIPDTFKNKPVTGISSLSFTSDEFISSNDMGFFGCENLEKIALPNTLKYIGGYAFYGCSSLTNITIPDRVTSIGDVAFCNCSSLTSITLPKKLKKLGNHVFSSCTSLTSLTIPDGVTSIGSLQFWDCENLTSLTIPDSTEKIGNLQFHGCKNLTSLIIPDNVKSCVTEIGSYSCCYMGITDLKIPDGITEIGEGAFMHCENLTSVTIPRSVKKIGKGAFSDSPLTTIYYRGTHDEWDILEDEIVDFIHLYYPNLETLYCTDGVYTFS